MNSAIHRDFPDVFAPDHHPGYFAPGILTRLSPPIHQVVTQSAVDQPPG